MKKANLIRNAVTHGLRCAFCLGLLAALAQPPRAAAQAGGMGQEMRRVQDQLRRATIDTPERKAPELDLPAPQPPPEEETPAAEPGEAPVGDAEAEAEPAQDGHAITSIELRGDAELLERLGLRSALEEEAVGARLSDREIQSLARKYNRLLVEQGYYLARMWTPPTDYSKGVLVFEVDQGRVGKTEFFGMKDGERVPYRGRWYSERQLRKRLDDLQEGTPFDYAEFYKSVFSVNTHPDLTMDTDLAVRREREDGSLRRYVDMDFTVYDTIPLHGVLEINNTGTEATEEWRVALTLQHLNLTKHDDVLTVTLPFSIDLSTLQSAAASYYVPYHLGRGGNVTVFGGYSELDSNEIVPNIDLLGEGWFVGGQVSYNLIENEAHELRIATGLAHQYIKDTLVLEETATVPREGKISPVSLILSYSSVRPDFLSGRNFLTSQTSMNRGGFLGADEDEEIRQFRETAEADYWIERLQYARIQPFNFTGAEEDERKWIVFLKIDGQLASGALIPAEQKAVGGMDNVRGYEEREVLGDQGVSGSIELRSPIYTFSFAGRLFGRESADRLQFVTFVDGAQMYLEDTLEGVDDNISLLSVGLGARLALTQYSQMKFDWGFPLEETPLSDSGGRGHISIEFQI